MPYQFPASITYKKAVKDRSDNVIYGASLFKCMQDQWVQLLIGFMEHVFLRKYNFKEIGKVHTPFNSHTDSEVNLPDVFSTSTHPQDSEKTTSL